MVFSLVSVCCDTWSSHWCQCVVTHGVLTGVSVLWHMVFSLVSACCDTWSSHWCQCVNTWSSHWCRCVVTCSCWCQCVVTHGVLIGVSVSWHMVFSLVSVCCDTWCSHWCQCVMTHGVLTGVSVVTQPKPRQPWFVYLDLESTVQWFKQSVPVGMSHTFDDTDLTALHVYNHRAVCRRYECAQYDLERAEDTLSSRSREREILVSSLCVFWDSHSLCVFWDSHSSFFLFF